MQLTADLMLFLCCWLGAIICTSADDDYYKVLGIERSATERDIKKAFRRLALKYHPDKNKDDPSAEKKFMEISKAYEILGDKEKRRQYDQFGDSSFGDTAQTPNFHDFFHSDGFFDDDGAFFFDSGESGHFPRGSAFGFDSAFDGFDIPVFDFDGFHQQHHENFHRNAHQFHQRHQNMHRSAHDQAREAHNQARSAHDQAREAHNQARSAHNQAREAHHRAREAHDAAREAHNAAHRQRTSFHHQSSGQQASGVRCRTTTIRHGNSVTTQTVCS